MVKTGFKLTYADFDVGVVLSVAGDDAVQVVDEDTASGQRNQQPHNLLASSYKRATSNSDIPNKFLTLISHKKDVYRHPQKTAHPSFYKNPHKF